MKTKENTMIVSFSGGETSGCMSALIQENKTDDMNIKYIFANTGLENEETLEFVKQCDEYFKLNVAWVEAVVNPIHGKGITHRVTNFDNAFRPHQIKEKLHPFRSFVEKSGIPNPNKPQCSDRLKVFPIEHYKKINGLNGCKHAIGIRNDEKGRIMSKKIRDYLESIGIVSDDWRLENSHENRMLLADVKRVIMGFDEIPKFVERYSRNLGKLALIYPLCDKFISTKYDIKKYWGDMPFRLNLEDHEGNCQTCWKKSIKKLSLIALENPERFKPFDFLEKEYSHIKPNDNGIPRVFFRKNMSSEQIINQSSLFSAWSLRKMIGAERIDYTSGCGESCEGYNLDAQHEFDF